MVSPSGLAWYKLVGCIYLVCSSRANRINQGCDVGCALRVASLPKNEPLLVVENKMALPDADGRLLVGAGNAFNVSCSGSEARSAEFEKFEGLTEMVVTCIGDDVVVVGGEARTVQDLGCKTQVKGDILVKRESCGNDGTSMELGFTVKGGWHGIIQVCHQKETSSTLYVTHQLFGASLPATERKNQNFGRPKFHAGNVYNFKPNNYYKKKNHSKMLAMILGGTQYADEYLGGTYLARGHLAPNSDFILDSYQDLTFFYVNAAPQWQAINNGNWASVERKVRRVAGNRGKTFTIITGTYGVLELPGSDNEPKEIWLYKKGPKKRLPVPHFFWKVVYDPDTRTGIAFVSLNIMRRDPTAPERLCEDVCDKTGWSPQDGGWRDNTKGYIYCCDVTELRRVIGYIPQLELRGLLSVLEDGGQDGVQDGGLEEDEDEDEESDDDDEEEEEYIHDELYSDPDFDEDDTDEWSQ